MYAVGQEVLHGFAKSAILHQPRKGLEENGCLEPPDLVMHIDLSLRFALLGECSLLVASSFCDVPCLLPLPKLEEIEAPEYLTARLLEMRSPASVGYAERGLWE